MEEKGAIWDISSTILYSYLDLLVQNVLRYRVQKITIFHSSEKHNSQIIPSKMILPGAEPAIFHNQKKIRASFKLTTTTGFNTLYGYKWHDIIGAIVFTQDSSSLNYMQAR